MFASELWIIYALIFGAVLLGVQGLYWFLFKTRREQKSINRRLALTAQFSDPTQVLQILRKERGVKFLGRMASLQRLNELVVQSGVRVTGPMLLLAFVVSAGLSYFLIRFLFGWNGLAIGLAIPLAAASIYLFLQLRRRRRIAAFSEQLPDALDVIVRSLRAGHPFRVALGLVAREMPDPVGSEFGVIADEIMFGLDQSVAVDNLCWRVGQDDLSYFATAINIQSQTGGNLAEIIGRLSKLLRNRSKLRLKIRALSAEGRASAIALTLTPFILFGVITLISRDYFVGIKDHPIVVPAAIVGFLLLTVGNVVMYRMVNFKF
jgi:tight adherence protein B